MRTGAKQKYHVQGISFPDEELLNKAKERASLQRRSLSNYICGLIEADLLSPLKSYPPIDTRTPEMNESQAAAKLLKKA